MKIRRTSCAHDHNSRNHRFSLECRLKIKEMFDITQTITPANILLNLSKANEQRLKVIEKNVELLISNKPQLLVPVELTIPKIDDL